MKLITNMGRIPEAIFGLAQEIQYNLEILSRVEKTLCNRGSTGATLSTITKELSLRCESMALPHFRRQFEELKVRVEHGLRVLTELGAYDESPPEEKPRCSKCGRLHSLTAECL
jgi:hypothetical protein